MEINGIIYKVYDCVERKVESEKFNGSIYEQTFVVEVPNYDKFTGEKMKSQYIQFERSGQNIHVDDFTKDDKVKVTFYIQGNRYIKDFEEKFFNKLKAIEVHVVQS